MRTSFSDVAFTVAIGVGGGVVALVGLIGAGDILPAGRWFGLAALAPALGALALALVSSGFRPAPGEGRVRGPAHDPASWLRRTRLMAAAALAAGSAFAVGWVGLETAGGIWRWLGLVAAILALASIYSVSMVYAARDDFAAWDNRWATPGFLAIAVLAGGLWLNALVHLFAKPSPDIAMLAVVALFVSFYLKRKYWRFVDAVAGAPPGADIAKHRRTAFVFLFAAPLALILIGMDKSLWLATACAVLAALAATAGAALERWLFVAEAEWAPPTR